MSSTLSSTSCCSSQASSDCSDDSYDLEKEQWLEAAQRLLKALNIEFEELAHCGSGTYHEVFKFDWIGHGQASEDNAAIMKTEAVLRVVMHSELDEACEMTNNAVATLNFVSARIANVPKILCYDSGYDNAFQRPYTIQTRLPGETILKVWGQLNTRAKCRIAEQLADFMLECGKITFAGEGYLCDVNQDGEAPVAGIHKFTTDEIISLDASTNPQYKSIYTARKEDSCNFARNPHKDAAWGGRNAQVFREELTERFDKLMQNTHKLPGLEQHIYNNSNETVLHHFDLHAGNILIAPSAQLGEDDDDELWDISGILDWDCAYCLPRPLNRQFPAFLWQLKHWEDFPDDAWNGITDQLDRKFWDDYDKSGEIVKAHYDDYMQKQISKASGPAAASAWFEDTYGAGALLRQLAYYCLVGFDGDPRNVELLERLVEELEPMTNQTEIDQPLDLPDPTHAVPMANAVTSDNGVPVDDAQNATTDGAEDEAQTGGETQISEQDTATDSCQDLPPCPIIRLYSTIGAVAAGVQAVAKKAYRSIRAMCKVGCMLFRSAIATVFQKCGKFFGDLTVSYFA